MLRYATDSCRHNLVLMCSVPAGHGGGLPPLFTFGCCWCWNVPTRRHRHRCHGYAFLPTKAHDSGSIGTVWIHEREVTPTIDQTASNTHEAGPDTRHDPAAGSGTGSTDASDRFNDIRSRFGHRHPSKCSFRTSQRTPNRERDRINRRLRSQHSKMTPKKAGPEGPNFDLF